MTSSVSYPQNPRKIPVITGHRIDVTTVFTNNRSSAKKPFLCPTLSSCFWRKESEDPLETSRPSDNEETVDDVHINPDLDSQQKKTLLDMLYEFSNIFIDFTCALLVIRHWAFCGVFLSACVFVCLPPLRGVTRMPNVPCLLNVGSAYWAGYLTPVMSAFPCTFQYGLHWSKVRLTFDVILTL